MMNFLVEWLALVLRDWDRSWVVELSLDSSAIDDLLLLLNA